MEYVQVNMNSSAQLITFNRWLSEYRGILIKIVRLYSDHPVDADDLYQEICISLWDSIPKFKGDAKESTWIYRVSLYTAIASLRQRKRQPEADSSVPIESYPSESEQKSKQNDLDALYQMLSNLNPVDRSLVMLSLEGCSYQEIAEVMGISVSNVGVKLNRIKNKLSEMAG